MYQSSCHSMNFIVLKSDHISHIEVQHWAGPEFSGREGDSEDLV